MIPWCFIKDLLDTCLLGDLPCDLAELRCWETLAEYHACFNSKPNSQYHSASLKPRALKLSELIAKVPSLASRKFALCIGSLRDM